LSPAPKIEPSPTKKKTEKRIPTYAASGARLHGVRLRDYSLSMIERLLADAKITVRRNRKGVIVSAQYRAEAGATTLQATSLAGTRYSFLEQIREVRVWSHRRLIPREDLELLAGKPLDKAACEQFVKTIFRAVPLSCLVEENFLVEELVEQ
jgi:hypothetical protein